MRRRPCTVAPPGRWRAWHASLSARIRAKRIERGWSPAQVADAIGVPMNQVIYFEAGARLGISAWHLGKLVNLYDCSLEDLAGWEGTPAA